MDNLNPYSNHNSNSNSPSSDNSVALKKFAATVTAKSIAQTGVTVDRYLLSKTWYDLLQKLAGRNPTFIDHTLINMAYSKILDAMKQKTDEELLMDMQDIIDSVEYARLNLPGLAKRGYYRR